MKTFIFISIILLCFACGTLKKDKQLEGLSKMILQLDSMNLLLKQNRMDSIVECQLAANALMLRIKNNYKPTKVDVNFGKKVNEFKELQMLFVKEKEENKRTLAGEYGVIHSSIHEEKKVLNLLKTDIENGRGDSKKYNDFIVFEQGKFNTIKGLLDHYLLRKTKYLPRFQMSMNELNEFMDNWEKLNVIKS